MSIINRMLADLERRGAPSRRDSASGSDLRASPPPRHRLRLQSRQLLIVVAMFLTVVAAALWAQRGGRILGDWPSLAGASTPPARLLRMSFEQADELSTLRLRVEGELARAPSYHRSGGSATLVVDAASGDLLLPAPPPGQRVFRAVALEPVADTRTRIRLEVEPAAELDLSVEGRRIALVGRMPVAAEPIPVAAAEEEPSAVEAEARPADEAAAVTADSNARAAPVAASTEAIEGDTRASASTAELAVSDEAATTESADSAEMAGDIAEAGDAADAGPTEAGAGSVDTAGVSESLAKPRAAGKQAAESVRKTQSMSPEVRARRRYREAREAIERGELAAARRGLQQTLQLDPTLHAARDLLVALVRRAGDTVTARRLLADGVELAPARVRFAMPYARLLVDTGELDRAVDVLEAARVGGSGSADFHALLAAIEQRRGQHRAAAAEYTRALEIRPGKGLWWLGLGISLAAIEHPQEAQSAFREARASGTLEPSLDRWAQDRIEGLNVKAEG